MQKRKLFKRNTLLFNILITLLINGLAIGLMLVLNRSYIHDENIFILFILAVLIITIETKSIIYSIISCAFLCLAFNFFLTEPQYSFVMDDLNYYISFGFFIIIAIIFGSIVIQLQKEVKQSQENEKRINILFDLSKKFLNCHDEDEIYNCITACLEENIKNKFLLKNLFLNKTYGNVDSLSNEEMEACDFSVNQFTIVGYNQPVYSSNNFLVFPIRSKSVKFGYIFIRLIKNSFSDSEFSFIKSISTEAAVVLERERAIQEQEKSEHKSEREHFKSTLLRSLSHDLKTPLTSIQSGSLFLKENLDNISATETKELLDDIYNESVSLYSFVNNLLNMSKISDRQSINKEYESLADIMQNVEEYFSKQKFSQKIIYPTVDETTLIYCNAQLMIQLFINLISNGIKYTAPGSTISVIFNINNDNLLAEISDNGGGIPVDKIKDLFKEDKRLLQKKDAYRSNGLGLIICKSIVEIHNGFIEAMNNDIGGASFKFRIPLKRGEHDDTDNRG